MAVSLLKWNVPSSSDGVALGPNGHTTICLHMDMKPTFMVEPHTTGVFSWQVRARRDWVVARS
jgi:hypothetical protein